MGFKGDRDKNICIFRCQTPSMEWTTSPFVTVVVIYITMCMDVVRGCLGNYLQYQSNND